MEGFGIEREDFLRKFLDLPNVIPDSDTFRRVFERLKIVKNGADYTIGSKLNQPALFKDVKDYLDVFQKESTTIRSSEKGHGRIETREYYLFTDISWLEQKSDWCKLKSIGMVKSQVFEKGNMRTDARYFISSLTDINKLAYSVRKHWSIENQLHWCLDVIFRKDSSRARKDYSPLNMNLLRKTSFSLLNKAKTARISKKSWCSKLLSIQMFFLMFSLIS